jgi:hypothetical protein
MTWVEQEDGRGYAIIGQAGPFPFSPCTLVRMHQAGSISGMVFRAGDVVWAPTGLVALYACTVLGPADFEHHQPQE